MKRMAASVLIGTILFSSSIYTAFRPVKTEADVSALRPGFVDDFESYETGKYIETLPDFREKWSNNVMDGGEPVGMDAHCLEKAQIVTEQGSDNKVLWLNNTSGANTFFYIAPKGDYRYKNFTAEFRVKFLGGESDKGWVSVDCRKDANLWYSGCNNILITIERTGTTGFKPFVYRVFSGSGTGNPQADTADLEENGYTLTSEVFSSEQSNTGEWYSIKYEVVDANYKVYVNDTKVVDYYYPSRNLTNFGYISLNGCLCDCYIDDFRVVNLDTEAPPALEEENPSSESEGDISGGTHSSTNENSPRSGCGSNISAPFAAGVIALCFLGLTLKKKY